MVGGISTMKKKLALQYRSPENVACEKVESGPKYSVRIAVVCVLVGGGSKEMALHHHQKLNAACLHGQLLPSRALLFPQGKLLKSCPPAESLLFRNPDCVRSRDPVQTLESLNCVSAKPYISIFDTTLRDGAQMVGISLSLPDKLKIAQTLVELGVEYMEVDGRGPNPKDAEFFRLCKAEILKRQTHTKLTAFGATRRKGSVCDEDTNVQLLIASDADVITIISKGCAFENAGASVDMLIIRRGQQYKRP